MLVITRKASESFSIGNDIKVTILESNGDKVKIGIEAPKSVTIMRSEVLDTIRSNIEAVISSNIDNASLLKQRMISGK